MGAWIGDVAPEAAAAAAARRDRSGPRHEPRRAEAMHAIRRMYRPRAHRRLVGARPREPHRRAHRLQRRVRAAVRDRAAHRTWRSARARTTASCASPRRFATMPSRSASPSSTPDARRRLGRLPARRRMGARRARRRPRHVHRRRPLHRTPTCRSARASRRRRRSRARSRPRSNDTGGSASTASPSPRSAAGREQAVGAPTGHHGPDRPRCSAASRRRDLPRLPHPRGDRRRSRLRGRRTELLVIDTGVKHSHATGGYARAPGVLRARAPRSWASPALRDLSVDDLAARRRAAGRRDVPPRAAHRDREPARARHRAHAARARDRARSAPLLDASHASMRDDFEISVPELDPAVEAAQATGRSARA